LLWYGQSDIDDPVASMDCFLYLNELGFDLTFANNNGHSIVHKLAQRNNEMLIDELLSKWQGSLSGKNFGRDSEGMRPSDLASSDGFLSLAAKLDLVEKEWDEMGDGRWEMGDGRWEIDR